LFDSVTVLPDARATTFPQASAVLTAEVQLPPFPTETLPEEQALLANTSLATDGLAATATFVEPETEAPCLAVRATVSAV
jgi:hypothetical protein